MKTSRIGLLVVALMSMPHAAWAQGGEGTTPLFTVNLGTTVWTTFIFLSLLGILWEADLGQPAVLAFLEQNWLEGGARPQTVAHLQRVATSLHQLGLIDAAARPLPALRRTSDDEDPLTLAA